METGKMMAQIDAAAFWVMAAMFVWFFYGPWQAFWADWYRQEVFAARDQLFDMAVEGKISFDDEAYKGKRRSMDLMIRFADQTTWSQILMTVYLMKVFCKLPFKTEAKESRADHDVFADALRPAQRALVVSIILRAPLLWPLFLIFGLIKFWEMAAKGTQNITTSLLSDKLLVFGQRATQTFVHS